MKKIFMYSFIIFCLLSIGFNAQASLEDENKKFGICHFETEKEACARVARASKFDKFFGPEHKKWSEDDELAFNDQDYPGLKACQTIWRDCSFQEKQAMNIVAHLLHEEDKDLLIAIKKSNLDTVPLTILVAGLSSSPVSELSGSTSCGMTTFDSVMQDHQSDDGQAIDQVDCKLLSPEQLKKQKLKAKKKRNQANKSQKNLQSSLEIDIENELLDNACKQAEQERLLQAIQDKKIKKSITPKQYGLDRIGLDKNFTRSKEGKMVVNIPCDAMVLRKLLVRLLDCVLADLRGDDHDVCYDYDILPEITYSVLLSYIEDGMELQPDVLLRVASLSQELLMCAEKIDGSSVGYRKYLTYTSGQIAKITELVVKTI